jgi:hypothetical protein
MDAAESLEDHQTRALNELIQISVDEEVVEDDVLALVKLHAGALKVKVDVQVLQEFSDWIFVGVRFLLDDLDQILQGIATAAIDDDGDRQVAQDVRASRLNDVQVDRLVQQVLDDQIASLGVVEEDEDAPVDEPCALCQQLHVGEAAVVDEFAQAIQVLEGGLPVEGENFGGQFAPQDVQVVLVARLHDHQADVQVRGGFGVVAAVVHVLGELVDALDDVDVDLKRGKPMKIESNSVAAPQTHFELRLDHIHQHLGILHRFTRLNLSDTIHQRLRVGLQLLQLVQHGLTLLNQLFGHAFGEV